MVLFFENSYGARRVLTTPQTFEEAVRDISKFLKDHSYTSYYMRTWRADEDDCQLVFDVGSHTEFFYLYKEDGWSDEDLREV